MWLSEKVINEVERLRKEEARFLPREESRVGFIERVLWDYATGKLSRAERPASSTGPVGGFKVMDKSKK